MVGARNRGAIGTRHERLVHAHKGWFHKFSAGIFDDREHGWGSQYTTAKGRKKLMAALASRRSSRSGEGVQRKVIALALAKRKLGLIDMQYLELLYNVHFFCQCV